MQPCLSSCTTPHLSLCINLPHLDEPDDQPSRAPRTLVPHEETRTRATEDVERSVQLTNEPAGICQGNKIDREDNRTVLELRLGVRPFSLRS